MPRTDHKPLNVFVSYAHPDIKWSQRLAKELEATGFDCWLDSDDITPGSKWDDEICRALDDADVCLVVLSKASNPSVPKLSKEWSAMQEVAWKKGDLALCSVKLGDVDPPPFLRKWRSLDVSKGSTDWQAIVASTRKLLKETQTKRFAPQDEKEADEATKRFEELHRVIEATRENDLKADAK